MKELNHWKQRVDELEEKERVANANVCLPQILLNMPSSYLVHTIA